MEAEVREILREALAKVEMLSRLPKTARRRTVAGDKAYDTKGFVAGVRALGFTPHVAPNTKDINAERRSRIDAIKDDARADAVAFNLAELRRHRQLTQVELAERLERAQALISAMETADDNLLSTVRSVVESMGGRLELVAVFDDERIAIATR